MHCGNFDRVTFSLFIIKIFAIFRVLFVIFLRYTGWLCRGMVSATTYTLVGVVNKFLTVLLNVLIWDKHSSPIGLLAVCLCLAAGAFYQQAPKREIIDKDKDSEPLIRSAPK